MKIKYIFVITAIIACQSNILYSNPLNLGKCFELARKQSDFLKAQSELNIQAKDRLFQARGGIRPNVDYSYIKTYRDTAGGIYSNETLDSKLTLSQPLFYGNAKKSAILYAKNDIEKSELIYINSYQTIKIEIIKAFYSIVSAQKDLENVKNTQKLLENRVKELNERVRLGKSRESEVLVVQSQIAVLIAQQAQVEGERSQAVEQLIHLTGADLNDFEIVDDIPEIKNIKPVEEFLKSAEKNPEIEIARKDVLAQKYKLKITKAQFLPVLNFNGSLYSQRSGSDSNWDAGLNLQVPVYQGGTVRSKVNEDKSKLRQYENILSQTTKDVNSEIRRLYRAVETSIKQMQSYKDAYESADKSYQIQINDYRYGLVNNLDVIQSMISMLDVKRNLDRSMIQIKSNIALLEIASGRE